VFVTPPGEKKKNLFVVAALALTARPFPFLPLNQRQLHQKVHAPHHRRGERDVCAGAEDGRGRGVKEV
jgi:hypothetical protein